MRKSIRKQGRKGKALVGERESCIFGMLRGADVREEWNGKDFWIYLHFDENAKFFLGEGESACRGKQNRFLGMLCGVYLYAEEILEGGVLLLASAHIPRKIVKIFLSVPFCARGEGKAFSEKKKNRKTCKKRLQSKIGDSFFLSLRYACVLVYRKEPEGGVCRDAPPPATLWKRQKTAVLLPHSRKNTEGLF